MVPHRGAVGFGAVGLEEEVGDVVPAGRQAVMVAPGGGGVRDVERQWGSQRHRAAAAGASAPIPIWIGG